MIFQILRFLLVITGTVTGVALGYGIVAEYGNVLDVDNPEIKLAALLGCMGYLFLSLAGREFEMWLESQLERTNSTDLAWSALGGVMGLVSANMLLIPVYFIMYKGLGDVRIDNQYFQSLVPLAHLVVPLVFNLLGASLGVTIIHRYRSIQSLLGPTALTVPPKVVDTSAIIDGRILGLICMGFIEGKILIPKFVVNEMQLLADSSDSAKRSKGRQGLALLNKLHKDFPDRVVVSEKDFPQVSEVDAKLVEHAKADHAMLITQDFNLKRVAELSDVKVLHLNDLMNVLKPSVTVGEDVEVQIVKSGKEPVQGVGFLPDGTMVVVEDGGQKIGQKLICKVTNILQTTAGRMVFARLEIKAKER